MGPPPFSHSDSALKIQKRRLRQAHCDNLAVCAHQLTEAEENIFKHGTPYKSLFMEQQFWERDMTTQRRRVHDGVTFTSQVGLFVWRIFKGKRRW